MKLAIISCLLLCSTLSACEADTSERIVFFLHNRFLEAHDLNDSHPAYGPAHYLEITSKLEEGGLIVISEKRKSVVRTREYALEVVGQIDSLLKIGVEPSNITVVGTSKGGYIAQYVSTFANNPALNFVFIASYTRRDIRQMPDINYCGNILTIYEKSDPYSSSAAERKVLSTCEIAHFAEIELNTGLQHGFLFQPLDDWILPTIKWASGDYSVAK